MAPQNSVSTVWHVKLLLQFLQRVHYEMMGANVRAVPISVVREKDGAGFLLIENFRDAFDRAVPGIRVLTPGFQVDSFQPVFAGLNQAEADMVATRLELFPTFGLTAFVAALGDRYIQNVPLGLTQQPQRQTANDDFVIRVWGKDQHFGRRCRNGGFGGDGKTTQGLVAGLTQHAGRFRNERLVGVHDAEDRRAGSGFLKTTNLGGYRTEWFIVRPRPQTVHQSGHAGLPAKAPASRTHSRR